MITWGGTKTGQVQTSGDVSDASHSKTFQPKARQCHQTVSVAPYRFNHPNE